MIRSFGNQSPRIHQSAYIADNAIVIGDVEIGPGSSVWFGAVIRGDVNYIRIGESTNIQDGTIIHVDSRQHPTILKDRITVGHRVTLHGCSVQSGCLIGMASTLMDGVVVGENSIVAAGALLTPGTIVPPNSLAIGSPAKVGRSVSPAELEWLDRSWRNYVELSSRYKD